MGRALRGWANRGELYGEIKLGQWFSFHDQNGHGYCQPDILIITSSLIYILECKLTYTDWAWGQLRDLYKPIVERVFERPGILIQVCKHIYEKKPDMIEDITALIDKPQDGLLTWHFLGN